MSSSVKSSPIQADIEAILQRQKEDCQKRPVCVPPVSTTQQDEEEQYPPYGTIQPRRMMAPDKTQPNILNEAMAKEAAMKYEQKQGKIQQAVAELGSKKKQTKSLDDADNDDPTEDPTETDGDDVVVDEVNSNTNTAPLDGNNAMARTVWKQVRKGLRPLRSGWEKDE